MGMSFFNTSVKAFVLRDRKTLTSHKITLTTVSILPKPPFLDFILLEFGKVGRVFPKISWLLNSPQHGARPSYVDEIVVNMTNRMEKGNS